MFPPRSGQLGQGLVQGHVQNQAGNAAEANDGQRSVLTGSSSGSADSSFAVQSAMRHPEAARDVALMEPHVAEAFSQVILTAVVLVDALAEVFWRVRGKALT